MQKGTLLGTGPAPPIFRLRLENIDQANELSRLEGWDIRFLPLDARNFSGQYAGLDLPGLYLAQKTYRDCSFHVAGSAPKTLLPMVLPMKIGRSFRCQGQRVTDRNLVLVDRARDIDLTIEGGIEAMVIYLSEETRRAVLHSALGPHALAARGGEALHLMKGPGVALLKTRLSELFRSDPGSPLSGLGAQGLSRYLTSLLVTAVCASDRDLPEARARTIEQKARHARRARDVMEARRHEPLVLTDLGATLGVSVRTLQYAFQDYFGVSPGRYHTLRRLAGAHSELKRADPSQTSVTDIATHWGFYHLGRFSRAYDSHFGRLPSQTLGQKQTRLFRVQRAPAARKPGSLGPRAPKTAAPRSAAEKG